jgi:hypothetical protein
MAMAEEPIDHTHNQIDISRLSIDQIFHLPNHTPSLEA